MEEDEKVHEKKQEIGPFRFEIDSEIDTEVLCNDDVYQDLIALDFILGKSHETGPASIGLGSHHTKLRKSRRRWSSSLLICF